jgi:phosphoglycolate phosphatase-like HAD superfamily hydrolase/predicted metalloenzyme YecM
MATRLNELIPQGEAFLRKLYVELEILGINTSELRIDHLCYRVATRSEYETLRHALNAEAKLLSEAQVNGRPIATYRLPAPFRALSGDVPLLELPSPKEGAPYPTGFEHAESVSARSFFWWRQAHPTLAFSEGGNAILNPELALKTPAGSLKLHYAPLDRVIEMEDARIQHVVFDLDGTLVDSHASVVDTNRRVFSEILGTPFTYEETLARFSTDFLSLCARFGVNDDAGRAQVVKLWGRYIQDFEPRLFKGARELLEALQAANVTCHIWTARDEESTRKILAHEGIAAHFETLSFGGAQCSKPDPASLRLDRERLAPGTVLMIGDSVTDMRGARALGAFRAAALWDPVVALDPLIEEGAELFFRTPLELRDWLLT